MVLKINIRMHWNSSSACFSKILELWGLPAINQYFVDLMYTRVPCTERLPAKGAKEILDLSLINDEQLKPRKAH